MFYIPISSESSSNEGLALPENKKYKKIIPYNNADYLTPLALAVWFMDDGSKINNTVRIATNCFTYAEIENLSTVLYKKYNSP